MRSAQAPCRADPDPAAIHHSLEYLLRRRPRQASATPLRMDKADRVNIGVSFGPRPTRKAAIAFDRRRLAKLPRQRSIPVDI